MSSSLEEVQARAGAVAVIPAQSVSTLDAEAQRVVAQVQAAYTIAQKFPRNINDSINRVKEICKVLEVAVDAEYTYKRGGKIVQGANIRIAEIIASQWKNLEYATVEIARGKGESVCEAYCVDLETNVKARVQFVVPHRRDKSDGGADLTSDRDIREMINNIGSRSVREQIFRVIPQFVVDAAISQSRETVKKADAKEPLIDRVRKLVPAFEEQKVSRAMLAKWLKCQPEEMIEQQFQQLRPIWRSLHAHQARVEDFFELESANNTQARTAGAKTDEQKAGAAPAADPDKEIPHDDPKKIVPKADPKKPAEEQKPPGEEKPAAEAVSDGPPSYEEVDKMIENAKDDDAVTVAVSLLNKNPNIDKKQGKALREKAMSKIQAFNVE